MAATQSRWLFSLHHHHSNRRTTRRPQTPAKPEVMEDDCDKWST